MKEILVFTAICILVITLTGYAIRPASDDEIIHYGLYIAAESNKSLFFPSRKKPYELDGPMIVGGKKPNFMRIAAVKRDFERAGFKILDR